MMHSSPMPLTVALDMAKRLHHELARHMTPEQRRDFTRVENLIAEAQLSHKAALLRATQESAPKMVPVVAPASRNNSGSHLFQPSRGIERALTNITRRPFWDRISSGRAANGRHSRECRAATHVDFGSV